MQQWFQVQWRPLRQRGAWRKLKNCNTMQEAEKKAMDCMTSSVVKDVRIVRVQIFKEMGK